MQHFQNCASAAISVMLLASVTNSCSKSSPPPAIKQASSKPTGEESCPANRDWIAKTTRLEISEPKDPKGADPVFECGFYQRSWEAFFLATRPDVASENVPAFLGHKYATFRSLFGGPVAQNFAPGVLGLAVRTPEEAGPKFDGGIAQANSNGIVVDKNGNPLFYSIEIDPVFTKFITDQKLNDRAHLTDPATDPAIPPGSLEIKAAWQIVEDSSKSSDYLIADATVPILKTDPIDPGRVTIEPGATPRPVKVALLGIHIVFLLQNHPEMIWATFEHIDKNGDFDLAPRAAGLPSDIRNLKNKVSASDNFVLYNAGTSYERSDIIPDTLTLVGQKLSPRSSIYRVFPWSQQANPDDPGDPRTPDPDVKSVDDNVTALLEQSNIQDWRSHYKLVGAVWLKSGAKRFGQPGKYVLDDFAGETGLSNVAIESFTQPAIAGASGDPALAQPNCLSCHVKAGGGQLKNKALGVSHLFQKFAAPSL